MNNDFKQQPLPWTGERYVPEIEGQIELEHLHRYLFAAKYVQGKNVLDIASGEGYGSAILASKANYVIGVDISGEAVNHARLKYRKPNLEFRVGSADNIPVDSNSVDVVVSFETIEHLDKHEEMMTEIKRVLKPGGILIISSPDKYQYSIVPGYTNPYHVKELLKEEFEELLSKYFKNVCFLGQRVVYGSLIVPEGGSEFLFQNITPDNDEIGLSKPIYDIAVASDEKLPVMVGGLFEKTVYGQDVAGLINYLSSCEQALAERREQIASLNRAVAERDQQIANLNQAVAERDEKVAALDMALAERDQQIASLNQAVADRDNQIASLNQTIQAIYRSRSWRMTAPVRFITRNIRKFLQPKPRWGIVSQLIAGLLTLPATFYFYKNIGEWLDAVKKGKAFFANVLDQPSVSFYRMRRIPRFARLTIVVLLLIAWLIRNNGGVLPALYEVYKVIRRDGINGVRGWSVQLYSGLINRVQAGVECLEYYCNLSDIINLLLPKPYIPQVSVSRQIDIIIPVYNGREFLHSLLSSIVKNTFIPYRLLIANDKSTDPHISEYLADFKKNNPNIDITIVENECNLGFVKTVNRLAELAKNHFVILNTDTEVPPHWLERLIYPIVAKDKVASVTPFTNAGTICSFPNFLVDNPIFEDMDMANLDSYFQYVDFEKNYIEIPTAVGFCMAVNKKVYDEIGLFDESFGKGYGEENDWSMRTSQKGYRNIIVPNLFVYHKHGGSFSSEEKQKLIEANLKLLSTKYPNYLYLVQDFIERDPLKSLRTVLQLKILSSLYKPVMILDHSLGGGANEYSKMLVTDSPFAIVIKYDTNGNYCVEFCGQKITNLLFKMKDIRDIGKVIATFNVGRLIINELVSYPRVLNILDFLVDLKEIDKNIEFVFMVHDFFCVCPMYNLLNYEIKYCDVPTDINYCNKCLKLNPLIKSQVPYIRNDYSNLTIELWRAKFGTLLKYASKIICFSRSSKEIIQKAYPDLCEDKFKIKPHVVDWVRPVEVNKTSETINIAVLGHLTIHKGAHVVASLATYIDYHNINVKVHIFGNILEPYESFDFIRTVIKHGRYRKTDLPKLMEENEIDVVFIPSICPETFSYATEEAIKMDLPIAVFDIGAPAERVKFYKKGIILEKQDPENILRKISNYLNKLVVINTKKKEDIVFVCVSNNELVYSRAILSSEYMTQHKILKYNNIDKNVPIPVRYNDAINILLSSNYSGWIFFVHNDFSIMEPIDNIVKELEHISLYGPIGAILNGSEKIVYGQILQGHKEGLIYHGFKINEPTLVDTVDCQCLFLHTDLLRKYNLRFDENEALSFHQYVEDFCLNANVNFGIRTYAVPMKCKHFSWGRINSDFQLAVSYINFKYPGKKWAGTCTHLQ